MSWSIGQPEVNESPSQTDRPKGRMENCSKEWTFPKRHGLVGVDGALARFRPATMIAVVAAVFA
jgi:hypothetical protein